MASEREFRRVVELVGLYHDEAERCAKANCFLAACVMVGAALEAALLAMVLAFEDELRDQGHWPRDTRPPMWWRLSLLTETALKAGWLPIRLPEEANEVDRFAEGDVGDVVQFIEEVRNAAVHPGRYVRDLLESEIGEPVYKTAFGVLGAVFDHTYAELQRGILKEVQHSGQQDLHDRRKHRPDDG